MNEIMCVIWCDIQFPRAPNGRNLSFIMHVIIQCVYPGIKLLSLLNLGLGHSENCNNLLFTEVNFSLGD